MMVVRSENPVQANTEVRRFFTTNTIPFDATSESSALSVAPGAEVTPEQNQTLELAKAAALAGIRGGAAISLRGYG